MLVDADDEMAQQPFGDLQPAIELVHERAAALDHFEDVDAFLVMPDFVGELAAAAERRLRLALLEGAAHAGDNLFDLRVQVGDLLLGRVGSDDVDQFVRAFHCAPCGPFKRATEVARSASGALRAGIFLLFVRCCVERVHHTFNTLGDEHLRGIGGPQHGRQNRVPLLGIELRQDVIGEIAPRVAASNPHPQPGELAAPQLLDDRLQPIVPAGTAPGAGPQASQRQRRFVDHHEDVGGSI